MGKQNQTRTLKIGDLAPDFALPNQHGQKVRLSDFREKSSVVLYFYPKDETPGCTAESCGFRDHYETFTDAGAVVMGVSADTVASHAQFAQRHRLPFQLLSDPEGQVACCYGVRKTLGILPGRVTFVIDRQGRIRDIFSSQFAPDQHIQNALAILATL